MANPYKKEGVDGHNAKLRRLTRHYGAADPTMNKLAPVDRLKKNGPEESVGFGSDSSAPDTRADRPLRRTAAANPLATYKRGGGVKGRAEGGRVKRGGKGKTNINIVVAPGSAAGGAPAMPPLALPIGANPALPPPMPPPAPPMGGPSGPGLMAMGGLGGPPGMPPGLVPPRKRGGRITGQAAEAEMAGMEKQAATHPDVKEDRALVKQMVKPDALKRAAGGKIGLTAGAVTGEGRLEKADAHRRNAKSERAQVV